MFRASVSTKIESLQGPDKHEKRDQPPSTEGPGRGRAQKREK